MSARGHAVFQACTVVSGGSQYFKAVPPKIMRDLAHMGGLGKVYDHHAEIQVNS